MADIVRFTGASASGLVGDTTLGSVTFQCAESQGSSVLNLTPQVFADATPGDPHPIYVTIQNGSIACVGGTSTPTPTDTPTPTPTPCTVEGQIDTDCDFVPDKYELAYFCLNPLKPDAYSDPDADWKANILEYAKGSNPCSGDTDGDGMEDSADGCQLHPEDYDGFQDADGCPDPDNDFDGVPDVDDGCPNVPEDFDAFQDGDGCLEPDNDIDGFPDLIDDCPGTDFTAGPDGIADSGDEPLDLFDNPIRTREDYDGVLDTDGCHDWSGDDYDGDGLTDEDEAFVHATDPGDPDTDGDGCSDGQEFGPDEMEGGRRDPLNGWDFFDPNGDGRHRVDDIIAVLNRYFYDVGHALYGTEFDRTNLGPNEWNLGPPNGRIRVDDIVHALNQYFHDCAP
jgi:hypothetical protein